jgi:hypothetical protein
MLQSAKNLVKFVQKFNPSDEAVISLGINRFEEVEAFLHLNKGNGGKIFSQIMPTLGIEFDARLSSDKCSQYLDLVGEVDGYKVKLTFLKEIEFVDITRGKKILPDSDDEIISNYVATSSPLFDAVLKKDYALRMNVEEWIKFEKAFEKENFEAIDTFINRFDDFNMLMGCAFSWSRTEEGTDYWSKIANRTKNVL